MSDYMTIGHSFSIGGFANEYRGHVIASTDAYFLVIRKTALEHVAGLVVGAALGQLAGGFVDLVIGKAIGSKREVMEVDMSDLPTVITAHPDWPCKQRTGRIIVVPRGAIDRIRYSFWGTYDLILDSQTICIALSLLRRRRVTRFLRNKDWDF